MHVEAGVHGSKQGEDMSGVWCGFEQLVGWDLSQIWQGRFGRADSNDAALSAALHN